jgi:hypothetical protein
VLPVVLPVVKESQPMATMDAVASDKADVSALNMLNPNPRNKNAQNKITQT